MTGSCRGVPHLNFLAKLNEALGQPLSIYYVDPHDFHWNAHDVMVDIEAAIRDASKDPHLLDVVSRTTIFIHEYFGNYGMFNTDPGADGGIYDHGMAPRVDVCLPNFHDRFVLFQNILDFMPVMRERVAAEGAQCLKEVGDKSMQAFREMCARTSFPEFADYFDENRLKKRFFWNHNHVTNNFTIPLFRMMNDKFLHTQVPEGFYDGLYADGDMFNSSEACRLTQEDVDAHGWDWGEPLTKLKV